MFQNDDNHIRSVFDQLGIPLIHQPPQGGYALPFWQENNPVKTEQQPMKSIASNGTRNCQYPEYVR